MDGPRGSLVIALLLLIAGFTGFGTDVPLFRLMGVGCVLVVPLVLIGEVVSQFREGRREAAMEAQAARQRARGADPEKRRR